jgi:hypothetical protein
MSGKEKQAHKIGSSQHGQRENETLNRSGRRRNQEPSNQKKHERNQTPTTKIEDQDNECMTCSHSPEARQREIETMVLDPPRKRKTSSTRQKYIFPLIFNKIHIITEVTVIPLSFDYWNKK